MTEEVNLVKRFGLIKGNLVFMVVGLLTLGLVVACGSASQPETSSESGTTDPGTSSSQQAPLAGTGSPNVREFFGIRHYNEPGN